MPAITWRDVAPPDFRTSLAGIETAGNLINGAFSGLRQTLNQVDDNISERANNTFRSALLGFNNADEFQAALAADPTLGTGVDTRRLNADSFNAAADRSGTLLNEASTRLTNETNQYNLDETRNNDARLAAARPAAARAAAAAVSGNQAEFQRLVAESPEIQGLGIDQIFALANSGQDLLTGNQDYAFSAENQGFDRENQGFARENQGYVREDREIVNQGTELYNQARSMAGDGPGFLGAFERLAQSGNFDPRAVAYAEQLGRGSFGNLFGNAGGSSSGGGGSNGTSGIGGGGSASIDANTTAYDFITRREGFREGTYWDVNHHRLGYGSDTVTRADGTVQTVTPGMRVSREDADRDLTRRIGELDTQLSRTIGAEVWNELPQNTRSAIQSVAYNYGFDSTRLVPLYEAAASNNPTEVARVIQSLGGDNDGVNRQRRNEEAALAVAHVQVGSPTSRNIETDIGVDQTLQTGGAGSFLEGLGENSPPISVARALRGTAEEPGPFTGVPVGFLTTQINEIIQRGTLPDGTRTINPVQAGNILARNFTQPARSGPDSLLNNTPWISRGLETILGPNNWNASTTPNLGNDGLRLNDDGITADIERATSGGMVDDAVRANNAQESTTNVNALGERVNTLRVQLNSLLASDRPGRIAAERPQLEAQLTAAIMAFENARLGNAQTAAPRQTSEEVVDTLFNGGNLLRIRREDEAPSSSEPFNIRDSFRVRREDEVRGRDAGALFGNPLRRQ